MSGPYSDEEWREFNSELKKAVLRGYPNPNRIGCPGTEVLKQLASRQLPVGHPAYGHVMECSPCYQELADIRTATPAATRETASDLARRSSSPRWIWATAVLAGLVVCALLAYYAVSSRFGGTSSKQEIALNVDLQHWRVFRSEAPGTKREPLVLPRQRLDLTFSLPVGSEDGEYDLHIASAPGGPALVSCHFTARLENHSETLRTRLDASSLSLGDYSLEIRRLGSGPLHIPIKITDQGIH